MYPAPVGPRYLALLGPLRPLPSWRPSRDCERTPCTHRTPTGPHAATPLVTPPPPTSELRPPILRECKAYSSARTPANATTASNDVVACCCVHIDHLPLLVPNATRGADDGRNKITRHQLDHEIDGAATGTQRPWRPPPEPASKPLRFASGHPLNHETSPRRGPRKPIALR